MTRQPYPLNMQKVFRSLHSGTLKPPGTRGSQCVYIGASVGCHDTRARGVESQLGIDGLPRYMHPVTHSPLPISLDQIDPRAYVKKRSVRLLESGSESSTLMAALVKTHELLISNSVVL